MKDEKEAKRLPCILNATETGSSRWANFQYLLCHFNSPCFHMFIRFSKMVEKSLQFPTFSIIVLTRISSQCVIKDYFQIAMFKEMILIFFFCIVHLQAWGKICACSDIRFLEITDSALNHMEEKNFFPEHYLRQEKARKCLLHRLSTLDILSGYSVQLISINTLWEVGMVEK